jgi:ParB family transcriptional regulator, chromosome partitioning protein
MKEMIAGSVKSAMGAAGAKSRDLWMIPVADLHVNPGFNVREKDAAYQARVRNIANSIKENGFFSDRPLSVFTAKEDGQDIIYITDGHTRFDAVKLAISEGVEIEQVPAVTAPAGTSMEDLTIKLVKSNEGQHLAPLEIAKVCKRLVDYGMEEEVIADRLGFTSKYVSDLLSLIGAPSKVRKMVADGTVSATAAIDTLKKHGDKAASVLEEAHSNAKAAGKEKITPKQVKKAAESKGAAAKVDQKLLKRLILAQKKHNEAPGDWFDSFLMEVTGANTDDIFKAYEATKKK